MSSTHTSPIRILHVIGCMDMGGAETFIMNMFRMIDREKYMFDFLVHEEERGYYDDEIEGLGGRIFRISRFNGINYFDYQRQCKDFFESHPEYKIVHGHIGSSAAMYLKAAKENGAYTIAHSHGMNYDKGIYHAAFAAFSYPTRNIADAFFACSQEAGINRFGKKVANSSYFHLINNGIDLSRFGCTSKQRVEAKRAFGVLDKPVFVHTGRFMEVKNHEFLIDVFAEIKKQLPHAVLFLAGDGPLKEAIQEKCAQLGLSDSVNFLGIRDDIPFVLKACDVFIFPSISEGLPNALVEAQATGLPCIISTGVPDSACFLDSSVRLPLEKGAKNWADICVNAYQQLLNSERQDGCQQVREAGFSSAETAQWLQNYYESVHQLINQ